MWTFFTPDDAMSVESASNVDRNTFNADDVFDWGLAQKLAQRKLRN